MKYILQQHKSSVIRFKYHENHGFTAKRIAYGQKKIKSDSTKCKTHKIKITQLSWCVFLQFNLYFIHIYSRYAFMLLSWRETDREKKGALLAKLITGWQFSKFLRSFLQKKRNFTLIFFVYYIHFAHTRVSLLNEFSFLVQPDLFNRFPSIERDFQVEVFRFIYPQLKLYNA